MCFSSSLTVHVRISTEAQFSVSSPDVLEVTETLCSAGADTEMDTRLVQKGGSHLWTENTLQSQTTWGRGGGLKLWPLTQKDWHFLFPSESEGRITNNKNELMLCLQLSVWLVSYMTHKTFIWKPLWQEVRHEKSTDIKAFFKIKHYADSCLLNPKTD